MGSGSACVPCAIFPCGPRIILSYAVRFGERILPNHVPSCAMQVGRQHLRVRPAESVAFATVIELTRSRERPFAQQEALHGGLETCIRHLRKKHRCRNMFRTGRQQNSSPVAQW